MEISERIMYCAFTSFLVEFRPFGVGYALRRVWTVQVVTIHLTNRFGPQVLLICNFALPIVTKKMKYIYTDVVESLEKIFTAHLN